MTTAKEAPGLKLLRRVLLRLRWDNQGGFPGYNGDGRWDFISTSLPNVTPDELNVLMDFAGVVPDKIKPIGSCKACVFSEDGRERGYRPPCLSCKRPMMSNFKPIPKRKASALPQEKK